MIFRLEFMLGVLSYLQKNLSQINVILLDINSIRSFQPEDAGVGDAASSSDSLIEGARVNEELFSGPKDNGNGSSFLAKLAIGVGVAATVTILSICLKQQNLGSSLGIEIQRLADVSSSTSLVTSTIGFSFKAFGYRVVLPQYAPGYVSSYSLSLTFNC